MTTFKKVIATTFALLVLAIPQAVSAGDSAFADAPSTVDPVPTICTPSWGSVVVCITASGAPSPQ